MIGIISHVGELKTEFIIVLKLRKTKWFNSTVVGE